MSQLPPLQTCSPGFLCLLIESSYHFILLVGTGSLVDEVLDSPVPLVGALVVDDGDGQERLGGNSIKKSLAKTGPLFWAPIIAN